MGLLSRKNTQTTVSVRMSLQGELLHYAELLKCTPSTLANDVLEGAFAAIAADEPGRSMIVLDAVRTALGKNARRRLSEEYHRVLFGTQSPETERATNYGRANASRAVPVLKKAKQEQRPYAEAQMTLFGCFEAVVTEEVGTLYESELMAEAAAEVYDPATVPPQEFFAVMQQTTELYARVYRIFLKDHLAREVVREIPPHFLPPP